MKGFYEWTCSPKCSTRGPGNSPNRIFSSYHSAEEANSSRDSRNTLWSSFFGYTTSILETYSELSSSKKNTSKGRDNGWTISVKKIFRGTSMRRLHERLLGSSRTGTCSSSSDIWLLGSCYKISKEGNEDSTSENGLAAFESDFSSRILITYRKGFECIGDSKWTSDVGWGCMLRSSQMLIAQALMFHRLGRYWRRNTEEMGEYTRLLRLFGDSKSCCFSIHNLLEAGKSYGLGPGSWVGPYAACRAWEALVLRLGIEEKHPLLVHVVSGDENGECGGAPAVCCGEIFKSCSELFSSRPVPVVLLVPLVLGLEKINPRYIPLLRETFTFPQSLGILGGRPGASTYIIGVQDDNAFYLDPHEVQPVVEVKENVPGVIEASSYHCSTVRRLLFDTIDPSLAIGFYCRDRGDLRDFCDRASLLAEHSGGAPLFTVACEQAPEAAATDAALHVAAAACDGDVWLRERDDDWQLL